MVTLCICNGTTVYLVKPSGVVLGPSKKGLGFDIVRGLSTYKACSVARNIKNSFIIDVAFK